MSSRRPLRVRGTVAAALVACLFVASVGAVPASAGGAAPSGADGAVDDDPLDDGNDDNETSDDTLSGTTGNATDEAENATETATGEAENATETATDEAENATEAATDEAENATEAATDEAEDATETATNEAENATDEATNGTEPVTEEDENATDEVQDAAETVTDEGQNATEDVENTTETAVEKGENATDDSDGSDRAGETLDSAADAPGSVTEEVTGEETDDRPGAGDAVDDEGGTDSLAAPGDGPAPTGSDDGSVADREWGTNVTDWLGNVTVGAGNATAGSDAAGNATAGPVATVPNASVPGAESVTVASPPGASEGTDGGLADRTDQKTAAATPNASAGNAATDGERAIESGGDARTTRGSTTNRTPENASSAGVDARDGSGPEGAPPGEGGGTAYGPVRIPGDVPDGTVPAGVAVGGGAAVALVGRRIVADGATTATVVPGSSTTALGNVARAAASSWSDRLWRWLGLLGYQRYAEDDPLEHDLRAALYERIREDPGIYLSALAEDADAPLGTVRYHLRILEFEGLVTTDRTNGKRRYVPLGVEPDALDAVVHEDAPRAVVESLFEAGPASTSELADRLDRDPSTITHHVQRLEEDGLVERERDGRAVLTRLDGDARAALARRRMDLDVDADTGDESVSTSATTSD